MFIMINYNEIEKLLVDTLEKETPESLKKWLDTKNEEEMLANLGEGEYRMLEVERDSFCHEQNKTNATKPLIDTTGYNYSLAA